MALKHQPLSRPFALAATAAMITTTVTLAFGAGVGLAADYQDAKHNVCEGTFSSPSCSTWGGHVTGLENIAIGDGMMPALTGGSGNVALEIGALSSNTTGSSNLAFGGNALFSNTTGLNNFAFGVKALVLNTTGSNNLASGTEALRFSTTGGNNLASGTEALFNNTTGSANLAFGVGAGRNLTTGSNNIDISNEGVAAESGTTRIGSEGKQTRAFVAGIYKKPVSTPACAVKVNSEGQLGCNTGENSTAIATFASRKAVASGKCLNYTDIAPAGTAVCPGSTTGFSSSKTLAGPTPANGATVTNLYADSSATVSGTDTVLVAVIDNTTGATLLSCTVNSTNKDSCSNASGSGSAAAGENIEVKLTATGESGNSKLWRVTFRF